MIEPVSPLGSNHTSLRMWAAYPARGKGELHAEVEPVKPKAAIHTATMESAAKPATLEMASGSHVMTCKCSLCSSSAGMESIASPVGGAKVVTVNLTGVLSEEEKNTIDQLRQRDAQVRRHEQAHLMAAGQHALGGAHYTYQVGPDGQRYAIGGEVQVDMSAVPGDPEATLRKAQQLQQSALSPVDPSGADRNVAMAAALMAQEARQDIAEKNREEMVSLQTDKVDKDKNTSAPDEKIGDPLALADAEDSARLYDVNSQDEETAQSPLSNRSQNDQASNDRRNLDFYA